MHKRLERVTIEAAERDSGALLLLPQAPKRINT